MRKKHLTILLSLIILFSYTTGFAETAEPEGTFTLKQGSVLSGGYPKLTVLEPQNQGGEGSLKVEWEIQFSLGDNPAQWDRILVGEILTDEIRHSPVRWRLTDESGNIWPDAVTSSALQMNWLSPDTMGWSISATEDMPFETLKDKQFSIKLTAALDPVLKASDAGREGVLNGAFINCYSSHVLKNYNSSYNGVQTQNASTAFERVSLFTNEFEPPENNLLLPSEENLLDTYNLPSLEYTPAEEPVYRMPIPAPPAPILPDSRDYRDLYVEGEAEGFAPALTTVVPDYISEITNAPDPVYDPYAYEDKNALAPDFSINAAVTEDALAPEAAQTPMLRQYNTADNPVGYDPSFEFNSEIEYPAAVEIDNNNVAYGSALSYPQDDTAYGSTFSYPQDDIAYGSAFSYPQDDTVYGSTFSYPQDDTVYGSTFSYPQDDTAHGSTFSYPQDDTAHGSTFSYPQDDTAYGSTFSYPQDDLSYPQYIAYGSTFSYPKDVDYPKQADKPAEPSVPEIQPASPFDSNNLTYGSAFSYPQNDDYSILYETPPEQALPRVLAFPADSGAYIRGSTIAPDNDIGLTPTELPEQDIMLKLYNNEPEITVTPAVKAAKPKTRSSAPKYVQYTRAADIKTNPTTYDKTFLRNIFVYLFLCAGISLIFTIRKQKR